MNTNLDLGKRKQNHYRSPNYTDFFFFGVKKQKNSAINRLLNDGQYIRFMI